MSKLLSITAGLGTSTITFRSTSSGETYKLKYIKTDQRWFCTCPGYTFAKGRSRSCKHLRDFLTGKYDCPPEIVKEDLFS